EIRRAIADADNGAIVAIAGDAPKLALTTPSERAGMIRILSDLHWTRYPEEQATLRLLRHAGETDRVIRLLDAIGYRQRVLDSVDDEALHAELVGLLGTSPSTEGDPTLATAIQNEDVGTILSFTDYGRATHAQRLAALRILLDTGWSRGGEERV